MWDTCVSRSSAEESKETAQPDLPRQEGETGASRFAVRVPYRKVMVTYDGSLSSEKAFDVGRAIAQEFNAKLLVLGISPLPPNPSVLDLQSRIDDIRERFSRRFYKIRLDGMNDGLQIDTMLALGDAGELTRHSAERFHAHLIVVGDLNHSSVLGATNIAEKVSVLRLDRSSGTALSREEICRAVPAGTQQEKE